MEITGKKKVSMYCIFITALETKESFEYFSDFLRMYNELEDAGEGFICYMILEDGTRVDFE